MIAAPWHPIRMALLAALCVAAVLLFAVWAACCLMHGCDPEDDYPESW